MVTCCFHRRDDLTRTQLRAQLAEMRPCELVLPSAPLSEATRKVLKAALRAPRTSKYSAAASAASVIETLEEKSYFGQWPEVLKVGMIAHLDLLGGSVAGAWRRATLPAGRQCCRWACILPGYHTKDRNWCLVK